MGNMREDEGDAIVGEWHNERGPCWFDASVPRLVAIAPDSPAAVSSIRAWLEHQFDWFTYFKKLVLLNYKKIFLMFQVLLTLAMNSKMAMSSYSIHWIKSSTLMSQAELFLYYYYYYYYYHRESNTYWKLASVFTRFSTNSLSLLNKASTISSSSSTTHWYKHAIAHYIRQRKHQFNNKQLFTDWQLKNESLNLSR